MFAHSPSGPAGFLFCVIPAQAGIQSEPPVGSARPLWIPAFAGMTEGETAQTDPGFCHPSLLLPRERHEANEAVVAGFGGVG